MSEHKHGSMDTKDQEKAFAGFIKVATNTAIICIVLIVLVALINAWIVLLGDLKKLFLPKQLS